MKKYSHILVFLGIVGIVAYLRWESRFQTLWAYDEYQLAHGLIRYDVLAHHPHPPGFPYLIGLGKLIVSLGVTGEQVLIMISLISGVLATFSLFFFFRKIVRIDLAFYATLTTQFCAIVWFTGERGMSDVAGLFWFYTALLFLFPFRNWSRSHVIGMLILGIALGIRPQLVLIAGVIVVVMLYRFSKTGQWTGFWVTLTVFIITNLGWSLIVFHNVGGLSGFLLCLRSQVEQLIVADSHVFGLTRYTCFSCLKRFLVDVWGPAPLGYGMTVLALIGCWAAYKNNYYHDFLILCGCFVPAFIIQFFFFNPAIIRYYIPYVPLVSVLSLLGLMYIFESRLKRLYLALPILVFIWLVMLVWGRSALAEIRARALPQNRAAHALEQRLANRPGQEYVLVSPIYRPFLTYLFRDSAEDVYSFPLTEPPVVRRSSNFDVYYFTEKVEDIGYPETNWWSLHSPKLALLSTGLFLSAGFITNPVMIGEGWGNYIYDYNVHSKGRFLNTDSTCLLFGRGKTNLLEINGILVEEGGENTLELGLVLGDTPEIAVPITSKNFIIHQTFHRNALPATLAIPLTITIRSVDPNVSTSQSSLFITSIRWHLHDM